jgi:hypothetical protein
MELRNRFVSMRVLGCLLVTAVAAAIAEEKPRALESTEKVTVSFRVLWTPLTGATSPSLTMAQDLAVGHAMVTDAMEGRPFSFGVGSGPQGCGGQLSIQSAESQVADHPLAWSADARVLEASTDRLVLSASWKRFVRGSDGTPIQSASQEVPRLLLREGDRVLLDFAPLPGSRCFRNAALELTARPKEDPARVARQIAYDLWLVHEAAGGKKTSARTQLTGRQGEQLPFAFARQKLPAVAGGGTAGPELQVEITGRVRGRERNDGSVELSLDASRVLSYVASDGSNDGGIGDAGQKIVSVRPGESIRVELPDPARGPAARDARASRMSEDLRGHSFAVIVTARPLS